MVSDLLKQGSRENTVTQEPMMPDWQLETGKQLAALIQKAMAGYNPGETYKGNLSADMTGFEKSGLGVLGDYINAPNTGDLFGAGKQQVMDTLGGKFADPNQSPFIKSMMNLSNMNLQDQITQARGQAGARGTYYTDSAIKGENTLRERTMNNLNAIIGQFIGNERDKMFQAAPLAQGMDQYANITAPLSKVGASQTLGSLQRLMEQSDLERQYQEFMRQRGEQSGLVNKAESLYSTSVPYGIKSMSSKSPSTLMSILGEIIPAFGSYNTHKYGYDTNQSSIKEMIDMVLKAAMAMGTGGASMAAA